MEVDAGYHLWLERALAMPYGKVATPHQNRQIACTTNKENPHPNLLYLNLLHKQFILIQIHFF